jgi:hypothetical protein
LFEIKGGEGTSFDTGETKFGTHEEFLASAELFDFPDYCGFFRDIVDASDGCSEAGGIGVLGYWNDYFDIICC